MKKTVMCIYFVVILCMLVSCEKKARYEFLHNQSEITAIEIVEVGEADELGINAQTILYEVSDIDAFMKRFNSMDCYFVYSDPVGVDAKTAVIKLIYENDEYELIGVNGQAEYTKEKQYRNYVGQRYFDKEQFNDFLSSYIDE